MPPVSTAQNTTIIRSVIAQSALANHTHTRPGRYFVKLNVIRPVREFNDPYPIEIEPLDTLKDALEIAEIAIEKGREKASPGNKMTGNQDLLFIRKDRPGLLLIGCYYQDCRRGAQILIFTVSVIYADENDERWPLSCLSLSALPPLLPELDEVISTPGD